MNAIETKTVKLAKIGCGAVVHAIDEHGRPHCRPNRPARGLHVFSNNGTASDVTCKSCQRELKYL